MQEEQPREMAGAAGFEPAVTGSKPDALPLGYAPNLGAEVQISTRAGTCKAL